MSDAEVIKDPFALGLVPDQFKTKWTCDRAVEDEPETLKYVPDHLIIQAICQRAIQDDLCTLIFVHDWLVTHQQIKSWYDDDYDDEYPEWYERYQKRKSQKAKIKEELLPIAWNPSRWSDWCIPDDEKKETEKLWK